jgi:alpha-galactosidase
VTNNTPSFNQLQPADMAQSRQWSDPLFAGPGSLPVTFTLGEQRIQGIPESWHPTTTRRRLDANLIETVFEGTDPASGLNLRVEVTRYQDHPVVEWVAWLTNTGSAPAPLIRDLRAIDLTFAGAAPIITHSNGDFNSAAGYTPRATPLPAGAELAVAPHGGRACDQAFPYFRLAFEDWGLALAVGWPAQWSARFTGTDSGVQVQAGQQTVSLRLNPGETIRTPRISVLAWAGDDTRAINLWRRWYLDHILPRPDGQPMPTLLALAATEAGEEFTAATEENQIRFIDAFHARGLRPDVWWIDAGWYPCYNDQHVRKWPQTGTWSPDPERFPRGLRPISDHAAESGADLLIWFEPERVAPGTQLAVEHPEWLLSAQLGPTDQLPGQLLFLGNPQARQWLTDHVCEQIRTNGIKIYRQDHNFEPLEYWRQNEPADRQGINENLHVQGYLQFWDDLLARNPGLWIDSCASGGRRNDLETMRRSVPLHYTDHGYGDPPVKLAFHRTLFEWIPYFKEFSLAWDLKGPSRFDHEVDSFSFHCGFAPMLFATLDIQRDDYDFALARQMIAIWRQAAPLMLHGDYYALTPFHTAAGGWVAHQFHRGSGGQGLLQAIRLPGSPREKLVAYPKGLDPAATYAFEEAETGETRQLDGETAMRDGLAIRLPERRGSLWFYQTVYHPGEPA